MMITLNERKMLIKSMNQVHRFGLPNDRDTRKAISELVFDGIYYFPLETNIYKRVDNLESLNDLDKVKVQKYIDKEMKSAIKLIRRMRKLSKFMNDEQLKRLHGELL